MGIGRWTLILALSSLASGCVKYAENVRTINSESSTTTFSVNGARLSPYSGRDSLSTSNKYRLKSELSVRSASTSMSTSNKYRLNGSVTTIE